MCLLTLPPSPPPPSPLLPSRCFARDLLIKCLSGFWLFRYCFVFVHLRSRFVACRSTNTLPSDCVEMYLRNAVVQHILRISAVCSDQHIIVLKMMIMLRFFSLLLLLFLLLLARGIISESVNRHLLRRND